MLDHTHHSSIPRRIAYAVSLSTIAVVLGHSLYIEFRFMNRGMEMNSPRKHSDITAHYVAQHHSDVNVGCKL